MTIPPAAVIRKAKPKWCIQVVDYNGNVMYLRHGHTPSGRIATFPRPVDAQSFADAMVMPGLDADDSVNVVRYDKSFE